MSLLELQPRPCAARDLRAALGALRASYAPSVIIKTGFSPDQAATDFAAHHAGMPAQKRIADEPAVIYRQTAGPDLVFGLYGSETRLRRWMPGLGTGSVTRAVGALEPIIPRTIADRRRDDAALSLRDLPISQMTPRDAGPYITMGFVMAGRSGPALALSAHRMLVLDDTHLGISMLSGRHLRHLAMDSWQTNTDLPITINIGVPPAVAVASATSTAHMPDGFDKLALAGALANAPVLISRPGQNPFLPQSEIVLNGVLTPRECPETLDARPPGVTMPEFLGYDGQASAPLHVIRVTGISLRPDAVFQATIGPGLEQSSLLAIGGALTQAFALAGRGAVADVADLRYAPSGGGMLLLFVALRAAADLNKARLARGLIETMPFTKTVVFVDDDIDLSSEADVFWAMTTRCNLAGDCHALDGFPALRMDPSQTKAWSGPGRGAAARCWIDATLPKSCRRAMRRSF